MLKPKKVVRKNPKNKVVILTIVISFLFLSIFRYPDNKIIFTNTILTQNISDKSIKIKNETLTNYLQTSPANIDDKFINWSIPNEVKQKLWESIIRSPINNKTGRHTIIFSIANAGMIDFIVNSLCSMQLAGIPKNNRITIALDDESNEALLKIDEPVVLLKSNFTKQAVNNKQIHDFYSIIKVKPTILHQFLLWDVEAITVDADTVFLKDPFHIFNDEADFEVQCDSKELFQIPSNVEPVPWQVNLGFFKVRPTEAVKKFMKIWLLKMYNAPKNAMQSMMRRTLKPYETHWVNNDTVFVNTSELLGIEYPNLTFRFLDPMLITNAGGLYLDGAKDWKKEAKRRKIEKPEMIHFFHIGKNSHKASLIRRKKLIFHDENYKCSKNQPDGAINFSTWK